MIYLAVVLVCLAAFVVEDRIAVVQEARERLATHTKRVKRDP